MSRSSRGIRSQDEAWTEFRYWAYCFVMPGIGSGKSENTNQR